MGAVIKMVAQQAQSGELKLRLIHMTRMFPSVYN